MRKILILLLLCVGFGAGAQQPYPAEEAFLKHTDRLYEEGQKWAAGGLFMQADWYYAQAAVAVESFQYALISLSRNNLQLAEEARKKAREEARKAQYADTPTEVDEESQEMAMEMFGLDVNSLLKGLNSVANAAEEIADKVEEVTPAFEQEMKEMAERLLGPMEWDEWKAQRAQTWDRIASRSIISPWPWFFEAVTNLCLGLPKEDAAEPYTYAVVNPNFPQMDLDLNFLATISRDEIKELYYRLDAKRAQYESNLGSSVQTSLPRDWRNCSYTHLLQQGVKILQDDENRYPEAAPWFVEAVKAFPFDADVICAAASALIANSDIETAVSYINMGLLLDPNNSKLQALVSDLKAALL